MTGMKQVGGASGSYNDSQGWASRDVLSGLCGNGDGLYWNQTVWCI